MTHKVLQIRDAMRTALLGQTDALNNVFISRVLPLLDAELPSIEIVISGDKVIERASKNHYPIEVIRKLKVDIRISVKEETGFEDKVYKIAGEIEKALLVDKYLGLGNALIKGVFYTGCDNGISSEGETNTAVQVMNYDVDFAVIEGSVL